jgi:DNA-binding transcriptional ArsR family regulator
MAAFDHPDISAIALLPVLRALADPIRLEVVRQLATVEQANCAALLRDRPKSSMSHHFHVLREAGLIRTEIHGVHHLNALRRADIEARFPGLLDAVLRVPAEA